MWDRLWSCAAKEWGTLKSVKPAFFAALILACAGGFVVASFWDAGEVSGARQEASTARQDAILARNCRAVSSTSPSCPVVYKNTRIEWKTKTAIKMVPDPAQAAEIGRLKKLLSKRQNQLPPKSHQNEGAAQQNCITANGHKVEVSGSLCVDAGGIVNNASEEGHSNNNTVYGPSSNVPPKTH